MRAEAQEELEMLSEDHGSKRSDGYKLDLERTRELAKQIASSSYNMLAKGLERIIGIFPHKTAVAFKPLRQALRAE
jgi:hypothetical protein